MTSTGIAALLRMMPHALLAQAAADPTFAPRFFHLAADLSARTAAHWRLDAALQQALLAMPGDAAPSPLAATLATADALSMLHVLRAAEAIDTDAVLSADPALQQVHAGLLHTLAAMDAAEDAAAAWLTARPRHTEVLGIATPIEPAVNDRLRAAMRPLDAEEKLFMKRLDDAIDAVAREREAEKMKLEQQAVEAHRAAMRTADGMSAFSAISTNSSPPRRASVSSSRATVCRRRATSASAMSPIAWPWLSLISLKRSRSRNRIAPWPPCLRAAASVCSRRSRNSARFGRPVSES